MDKLKMHSPDLIQRNIDRLAELFPAVVTEQVVGEGDDRRVERAVDFDLLRQELSDHVIEGPQERYQLEWPGKREALFAANAPISKTLRPVREESVDFDTTQNLFVEGDNLDALKLLQESYLGKVDLIYIDPPYNTGNDFVYNDAFAKTTEQYLRESGQVTDAGAQLVANPESNGRFHSDWLSMMYPRLKLARNLLTEEGLIFISIDDHELDNLRKLGNEVFGERNFVGLVTRATGTPTGGGFDGFSNAVDYIVVYRRSDLAILRGLEFDQADAAIYNESDDRGKYLTRSLRRTGGEDRREDRPSMYYGVEAPDGTEVFPIGPGGYESRWICSRDKYRQMVQDGLIEWKQVDRGSGREWHPYQKFYLQGREKRPSNLWTDLDGNKKGTREVRQIFGGEKVFDSPKPVGLLQRVVQIGADRDATILDFFGGSGSTAHAVIKQNAEDGGTRRFILVQLPEPTPEDSAARREGFSTIAEIARRRIELAGAAHSGETQPSIGLDDAFDAGFRVLRVDSTNMSDVRHAPDGVEQAQLGLQTESIKSDRSGEDLLFQVLLDWGLELAMPVGVEKVEDHEVFVVEEGALVACFNETVNLEVVRWVAARKPLRAVFRDSAFHDDAARINAEQIFAETSPATDVKVI